MPLRKCWYLLYGSLITVGRNWVSHVTTYTAGVPTAALHATSRVMLSNGRFTRPGEYSVVLSVMLTMPQGTWPRPGTARPRPRVWVEGQGQVRPWAARPRTWSSRPTPKMLALRPRPRPNVADWSGLTKTSRDDAGTPWPTNWAVNKPPDAGPAAGTMGPLRN